MAFLASFRRFCNAPDAGIVPRQERSRRRLDEPVGRGRRGNSPPGKPALFPEPIPIRNANVERNAEAWNLGRGPAFCRRLINDSEEVTSMSDEDDAQGFLAVDGAGRSGWCSRRGSPAARARAPAGLRRWRAPTPPARPARPGGAGAPREDFFCLQLSDTHWGYEGAANPEARTTLKKTVAAINASARHPDFIVFTGDLTHTTDDAGLRRARMAEFKQIVSGLKVKDLRFMPGEHDASLDRGEAYREHFGETHYAFDHKGIHFVALDNVSDPDGALGDAQIAWLAKDLGRIPKSAPIVVFAHRPLFDLYPQWDWATRDGARAVAILSEYPNVTVFYGHIHQEHHQMTGRIAHHSARSLIFPLPAPGSAPKRAPLPWDPASPTHGIGYRGVEPEGDLGYRLSEIEG